MKTFKQLLEKIEYYRTRPHYSYSTKLSVGKYDTDYFDKIPDTETYRDEGKVRAFKHELIPKKPIVSNAADIIPQHDDIIHRISKHAQERIHRK